MEAILDMDWKDIAKRAAWTFLQAFLAVFLLSGESFIDLIFAADWGNLSALFWSTAVGAVAAGTSALKTVLVEAIRVAKEEDVMERLSRDREPTEPSVLEIRQMTDELWQQSDLETIKILSDFLQKTRGQYGIDERHDAGQEVSE